MNHIRVEPRLRVPAAFEATVRLIRMVDPSLRLRRSIDQPWCYVLERRCRRAPAINTAMRIRSDMHLQARDGYIHVSSVHPSFMAKPGNLVRALKTEGVDLWVEGGADQVADELEYEERWAKETRRRRRLGLFRDIAREGFDLLNRINSGGERSRISNAGTTSHVQLAPA